jgi:hypothetical protein
VGELGGAGVAGEGLAGAGGGTLGLAGGWGAGEGLAGAGGGTLGLAGGWGAGEGLAGAGGGTLGEGLGLGESGMLNDRLPALIMTTLSYLASNPAAQHSKATAHDRLARKAATVHTSSCCLCATSACCCCHVALRIQHSIAAKPTLLSQLTVSDAQLDCVGRSCVRACQAHTRQPPVQVHRDVCT